MKYTFCNEKEPPPMCILISIGISLERTTVCVYCNINWDLCGEKPVNIETIKIVISLVLFMNWLCRSCSEDN